MNIFELNEKIAKITFGSQMALVNYLNHQKDMVSHPLLTHEFDSKFRVWFTADAGGTVARTLSFTDHILVSFSDYPRQQFVSLTGQAHICKDHNERMLHVKQVEKYQSHKKLADNLWLICFEPEKIELWDYNSEMYVQYLKYGANTVLHSERELKKLKKYEFSKS